MALAIMIMTSMWRKIGAAVAIGLVADGAVSDGDVRAARGRGNCLACSLCGRSMPHCDCSGLAAHYCVGMLCLMGTVVIDTMCRFDLLCEYTFVSLFISTAVERIMYRQKLVTEFASRNCACIGLNGA